MTEPGLDSERINRFFNGQDSEQDSLYVNEVFCDNSKEKELKHLLSRQFNELLPDDEIDIKNLDHILYKIHYEINTRRPARKVWPYNNPLKWALRIASVIILPLVFFFGIQTLKDVNSNNEAWVEIKAPAWTRAQFSLSDGTIGWLNSNSSVKYNGSFSADRQVTLKGEAFFDVAKDEKRPFVVNTEEIVVTALGTRFNIASYEDEKNVEVVLEEGKLIFSDKEMNKSYTMKPNDLVKYDKTHKDFSTEVVEPNKYVSWTEGKLVFRNDPVDVIARRLARWYNVDVEVNGSLTDDIRLRATFTDENLEEVMNLLKRSLPIDYKIVNGNTQKDDIYIKTRVIISSGNQLSEY